LLLAWNKVVILLTIKEEALESFSLLMLFETFDLKSDIGL